MGCGHPMASPDKTPDRPGGNDHCDTLSCEDARVFGRGGHLSGGSVFGPQGHSSAAFGWLP